MSTKASDEPRNVAFTLRGIYTRHFELEGVAPAAPASFQVRERVRKWITPGRMSHLTRLWDNIHGFRTGDQGATLLDFTTQFKDESAPAPEFSGLEISEKAIAQKPEIYEARWIGNPFE